jgi:hypothetical protein
MTANNHPEPQPLSQDSDDQSTVASPDDSSLIGTEPDEVIGNLNAGSTGSVEGGDSDMPRSPGQGGKTGKAGKTGNVAQPLDDDSRQS